MKFRTLVVLFTSLLSAHGFASDSLSYSGRLVNANGSPVTGSVGLVFEFAYTNSPGTILCTDDKTSTPVALTNGVFHVKLTPTCGTSFAEVLANVPAGQALAIRVTDSTNSKVYSFQALHSMPFSLVSHMTKQIEQMGAADKQVLAWDDAQKKWLPSNAGAGNGSVTSISTGTGLSGGPITNTGTISIATKGVTTALLDDGAVTGEKILNGTIENADISSTAAIDRSKLAIGTPNYVLINDGSGGMSGVAQLPITHGGTGASTASGARTNLGLGNAAEATIGYAAGNVMPADGIPTCAITHKLLYTGVGPTYWGCELDNDSADGSKLPLTGGTLTGNLVMNTGTKITIPDAPTAATDAVNRDYVDDLIASAIAGVGGSQWTTSGSNIYYNVANGNVGIGTTSPTHKLQINNTTNASATSFNISSTVQVSQTADQYGSTIAAHYGTVSKNSGFAIYRLFGGLFSSSNLSGSATEVVGVSGVADGRGTSVVGGSFKSAPMGTIDNAYGVEAIAATESSTVNSFTNVAAVKANIKHGQTNTTISNAKVLDVSIDHTGSGAITNAYGIYLGALGGAATVNRWAIYSADSAAKSHFAGNMNVAGNSSIEGKLQLKSDTANYVEFKAPSGLGATRTFFWPGSYGTAGHVLTTDGAGNLSWAAASSGAATLGGELSGTTASATIANNVITSTKIVDGTIIGDDIANTTIPYAKLNLADNDIPQAKVNGLTTALSGKEPTIAAGTSSQYWRGDKTWQTLNTAAVTESTNLYFTEPRVLATDLTGLNVTALLGPVTASDDVLSALGKLQGQVTANKTSFDDSGVWSLSGGNVYRPTGYVSVGTATPIGVLTVAGNTVNSWATGTMRFASDASANYIQSGVDTTSGSARDLRFSAYNSNIPFMTIKADGNVGIGLAAPTTKLHVHSSTTTGTSSDNTAVQISSANRNAYLQIDSIPATGGSSIVFSANASERGRILYQNATNDLTFSTNAAGVANGGEKMRITGAGNVGIGTNAPAQLLHVNGISQFESYAIMKDTGDTQMLLNHAGAGWGYIGNNAAGIWSLGYTNTSSTAMDNPVLAWTNSGRVGIGTTTPSTKLDVVSDAVSVAYLIGSSTNSTNLVFSNTTTGGRIWSIGTSGSAENAAPVGSFNFYDNTAGASRLTILPSGSVGIGVANPQAKLDVFAATGKSLRFGMGTNGDPTLRIVTPDTSTFARISAGGPLALYSGNTDSAGNTSSLMVNSNGRVGIGIDLPSEKLHVVGNILASGTITPSDKRLKKNFEEIKDPLLKVMALSAVTYEWKDSEKHGKGRQMGVVAQEVKKVFPEAVTTTNDGFLAVSYQVLVAPLIGAVKELYSKMTVVSDQTDKNKREIASLKEENSKMKAEAQQLKDENAAIKSYLCSKDPAAPICK